jgi:endonuclease/exonuclease/phosphatase family metal-dependent hydrolase
MKSYGERWTDKMNLRNSSHNNHRIGSVMTRIFITAIVFIILALLITGCPATKETAKHEAPPPPPTIEKKPVAADLTLTVASINLSSVAKRIEKKDIENLAAILKKEKADIITVQGISRYPGLSTRIDVFEEIAKAMEMRSAFGESMTLSGRQTGNAVFSTYPIRSNDNLHYQGISSVNSESALQVVIDGGSRDIVVVSTLLPEQASANDIAKCVSSLSSIPRSYEGNPVIVTGNIPSSKSELFKTEQTSGSSTYRIWHTTEGLKSTSTTTTESGLGTILLTQFGVYRKP